MKVEHANKIYVYFAVFHDRELFETLYNLIDTADNPKDIIFGIYFLYEQDHVKDVFDQYIKNFDNEFRVRYEKITPENITDVIGLAKGRIKAYSMCQGEEYRLLIDGHMQFTESWDTKLKRKLEIAYERNITKPIICGYAGSYGLDENGRRCDHPNENIRNIRYQYFIDQETQNEYTAVSKFDWHDRLQPHIASAPNPEGDEIIPAVRFSGNFSFCKYNIVEHLPEWVIFEDEEMPWSSNLHAAGFTFVFPLFDEPVVMHLYMGAKEPYDIQQTRDQIEWYYPDYDQLQKMKYDNICNYLDDPDNYDKIRKYEDFARINLIKGKLQEYYVPENF